MLSFLVLIGCEDEKNKPETDEIVVYDPDVKNVIYNYCLTCHFGNTPSAGLILDNYENVKAKTESGSLLARINSSSNPMPPGGLIPANKRELIQKWADGGYIR